MMKYVTGDILDSEDEAIVIPVNCAGVMGKGLALQFRNKYPHIYKIYLRFCSGGELKIGEPLPIQVRNGQYYLPTKQRHFLHGGKGKYYFMFPTKRHWRDKSSRHIIQEGLDDLANNIFWLGIGSISIPKLGCGLGGMQWEVVKPMLEELDRKYRTDQCIVTVYVAEEDSV